MTNMMKLLAVMLLLLSVAFGQKVADDEAPADFDETPAPDTDAPVIVTTAIPVGMEEVGVVNAITEVLKNQNLPDSLRTELEESLTGTGEERVTAINNALASPNLTPYQKEVLGNALAAAGRVTPQPTVADDDDFPWWLLFLVLGGVLVACCLAAALLWRKNQQKPSPHVPQDFEAPTTPSSDGSVGMKFDDFMQLERDMLKQQAASETLQTPPPPAVTPPPFAGRGIRAYQPRTPPPRGITPSRLRALPEDDISLPFSTLSATTPAGRGHLFTPRPSRRNTPTPSGGSTPTPSLVNSHLTYDKITI